MRRFKELQPILTTIIRHTKRLANVSTCRIYLLGVDSEGQEVLFEVGELDGHPVKVVDHMSSSLAKTSSSPSSSAKASIRTFSHHFNRHPSTPDNSILSVAQSGHFISSSPPSSIPSSEAYLRCVRVAPLCTPNHPYSSHQATDNQHSLPMAEPIVEYVARTGEAVMCIRDHPGTLILTSSNAPQMTERAQRVSSDRKDLLLLPTAPVTDAVLCYPVFDDMGGHIDAQENFRKTSVNFSF